MSFALTRPDHISNEAWAAIEYRRRLQTAASTDDRPSAVGAAKKLI